MSIFKSIKYAIEGLAILIEERNFRIHLAISTLVILAGTWFGLSKTEWMMIVICISMVMMAEGFNTAIELMCDRITSDHDDRIKHVKDLSAAAVLIMATGSAIIGSVIFLPKIL